MIRRATVVWCTGMSGAGKSTLAQHAQEWAEDRGAAVLLLDGDVIRNNYSLPLGYGREDVEKNNLNVAAICEAERHRYDLILVPVISPIDAVRKQVRAQLSPNYHLIFCDATIEALRARDPKGLYQQADRGEIVDLIGYCMNNPYDRPTDCELRIDTSDSASFDGERRRFLNYLQEQLECFGGTV